MATTWLKPIHIGKGKTIAASITDRTDYAENPLKTRAGELVTGYQCDPRTVDVEFLLAKKQYTAKTAREQGDRNVIAYHTRQAFRPGEITPEDANRIGYELATRFTKGNHQFIVATHIDKEHIHNHIVFNSTNIECNKKFRNFWGSTRALRRLSDQLCVENGLSIIENPKASKGHYRNQSSDDKPSTFQEKLRQTIDNILEQKPESLEAFITLMKSVGYEVKQGKYLAFRSSEQKRFTRLRSLGDDYDDAAIIERIEGKRVIAPKYKEIFSSTSSVTIVQPANVNLLIDIQNSIKAKNSPGYEHWATIFNLKQSAKTLIYLQENNLTDYALLEKKTAQATARFNELSSIIKSIETRLNEISGLQKHISNYIRTREVYAEYRKSGYNKKFYTQHEGEIILHQASKKAFDELGLKKLPTIKALQTEYATLLADKKKLYSSYREAKEQMREISTIKANADQLLNYNKRNLAKEKEKPQH